ncbi:MAG: hypothetical protein ACUVT1_03395 [Anaerolineae bacterium]
MRLIVTVDTEADNQWEAGRPLSLENLRCLPALQELCRRWRIPLTYFITSEVAEDAAGMEQLRAWVEQGEAEVGAHLHPWTTPPFEDAPGRRFNDPAHPFPSQLPHPLLAAKLETLTRQIERAVGRRPTSFRAGRFGMHGPLAGLLVRQGYLVDSSITPGLSWHRLGGPDFTTAPLQPYHPDEDSVCRPGKLGLWEIPLTMIYTRAVFRRWPALARWYGRQNTSPLGRLMRLAWPGQQPLWLRPSPRGGVRRLLQAWMEAERLGLPFGVLMLHSSELMPGGSPYWRTPAAVGRLLGQLERFFQILHERGIPACTLTEAGALLDAGA